MRPSEELRLEAERRAAEVDGLAALYPPDCPDEEEVSGFRCDSCGEWHDHQACPVCGTPVALSHDFLVASAEFTREGQAEKRSFNSYDVPERN